MLCLGIDPDPTALPAGFEPDLRGVERFAALLVEAAAPHAAAVKPNLAFFEAFGSGGIAALERVRAAVPSGVLVVADAKRGDIGSTAARQAVALFDGLGADAVTVNPYLGGEAIAPLIERVDRFAYVLCRTSNPGAGELQDLEVPEDAAIGAPAEPLHRRVARRVATWGPGGTVGLVVGATAPAELAGIRAIVPGLGVPGPGRRARRAATSNRSSSTDRRRRHRPAAGRVGDCWSTSRAASPGPPRRLRTAVRPTPSSVWRPLPPTGRNDSLCYPSRRAAGSRGRRPERAESREHRIEMEHLRRCRTSEPPSSSSSW